MSVILCRPEHNDGIGVLYFVTRGVFADLVVHVAAVNGGRDQHDSQDQRAPLNGADNHSTRLRTFPAKKSRKASNVTGPSRTSSGGSVVRSSKVEPLRAGN